MRAHEPDSTQRRTRGPARANQPSGVLLSAPNGHGLPRARLPAGRARARHRLRGRPPHRGGRHGHGLRRRGHHHRQALRPEDAASQTGAREDLARRIQHEARTCARLHHPNIVEVITAGVTADDLRLPYYLMERLNGQSLRVILEKKGQLELSHAYHIGIDLLDAPRPRARQGSHPQGRQARQHLPSQDAQRASRSPSCSTSGSSRCWTARIRETARPVPRHICGTRPPSSSGARSRRRRRTSTPRRWSSTRSSPAAARSTIKETRAGWPQLT